MVYLLESIRTKLRNFYSDDRRICELDLSEFVLCVVHRLRLLLCKVLRSNEVTLEFFSVEYYESHFEQNTGFRDPIDRV